MFGQVHELTWEKPVHKLMKCAIHVAVTPVQRLRTKIKQNRRFPFAKTNLRNTLNYCRLSVSTRPFRCRRSKCWAHCDRTKYLERNNNVWPFIFWKHSDSLWVGTAHVYYNKLKLVAWIESHVCYSLSELRHNTCHRIGACSRLSIWSHIVCGTFIAGVGYDIFNLKLSEGTGRVSLGSYQEAGVRTIDSWITMWWMK